MCLECYSTVFDTKPYCFSKPQTIARATATATWAAPQRYRHGVIFTPTTAPSRMSTTPLLRVDASCANIPAAEILLAVCCQFSSVSPPCTKKYIRGQDPVVLCACEFVNCTAESRIRTSVIGRRGSKAFLLALHDKDKSFFINSRTTILFLEYRHYIDFVIKTLSHLNFGIETLSCLSCYFNQKTFYFCSPLNPDVIGVLQ